MAELRSYAQWGEDLLVWDFFQRRQSGFFIEVGANDPQTFSQTCLLEQNGWSGILVEPQASWCEKLRLLRKRSRVVQAACAGPDQRGKARFKVAASDDHSRLECAGGEAGVAFVNTIEVEVVTLDELLAEPGTPRPDFLSIDVEGAEIDVLRGCDLARHRPALILVEDHVHDLHLHSYLRARGYKLVRRTGSNNWYVPQGTRFASSLGERLALVRKMYLGMPFRKLKRAWEQA